MVRPVLSYWSEVLTVTEHKRKTEIAEMFSDISIKNYTPRTKKEWR